MVYQLLYFVERPRRGLRDALAMRGRVLGLRRFLARARRKQDHRHHTDADERANLLAQVHIITILSSLSFCLRALVDGPQTQHKELVSS